VTDTQIAHLGRLLDRGKNEFLTALKRLKDERVDIDRISVLIDEHGLPENSEAIMRILEKRWFNRYYSTKNFSPPAPDPKSYRWRLFFSLIDRINRTAKAIGAKLIIFSDNEMGHYLWERYWYRIREDETSKENYLAPIQLITTFSNQNDIGFIENTAIHRRARNDPHLDIEGNAAMASNIFEYLMKHYEKAMHLHKSIHKSLGK
jgi:hypothetical protein